MKLAIMQPTFNPWLGYFDLIDYVDRFVFLDTVQLNQQSWQTRNKIKIQGKEHLISIPVQKSKSKNELLIKDTLIDFRKFDFREKLFRTLEQNYKKSKYHKEVNSFIEEIVFYNTDFLGKYNINIIRQISSKFKFDTNIISLSDTDYQMNSSKGDLILDVCKFFNSRKYVSPLGSKDYLDKEIKKFNGNNINVYYQYYKHPIYGQLGDSFIPYIGIFDLLYNEGFKKSKKIILSGREYKEASCVK